MIYIERVIFVLILENFTKPKFLHELVSWLSSKIPRPETVIIFLLKQVSLTFATCGKDGKDKFEIERPDLGLASVTAGWGIGFRVGDEIFTNYFSSSSFWKYSQIHNISEIFTICFSNFSSSQYQQSLSLSLGAVHKWRHHFLGLSRPPLPPLPLVIMSPLGFLPPRLYTRKCREEMIRDKTAYAKSLMFVFSAQLLFLRLGLICPLKCFKIRALSKISEKEGILSSVPDPP